MKIINLEEWPRKRHYEFFKELDYPHFNICTNLNFTNTLTFTQKNKLSLFKTVLYAVTKAVNNSESFKYRARENNIVYHEIIHPSYTVMGENDLFSYCMSNYNENMGKFFASANEEMAKVKTKISLAEDYIKRDDLIYLSCLPFISFTGLTHPINMSPADSIPRISWGKLFEENQLSKLPVSVQVNHALVDGIHVSKFLNLLEEMFNNPEAHFLLNQLEP